jgi:lipopolysaccharide export system protein LptC
VRRLRLLFAAIVILAAGSSWWLSRDSDADATVTTFATPGSRDVDYRIKGFDVIRMTAEGDPAHRLVGTSLKHFTDDDTTELEAPRMTVFQADQPPWEIDAEQAWLSADGSVVLLTGRVLIERAGAGDAPATRIITSDLRIQPRQDYAETDEPVRVESGNDRLDAVGMQAWLRPPSRLKFLSAVEGFYVPR